jgi:hypothetical protein
MSKYTYDYIYNFTGVIEYTSCDTKIYGYNKK